jgi:fatty-acyl-CoA synthase
MPKRIHVVAALSTTAVGKIFKPALVQREIEDALTREVSAIEGVASCHVTVSADKLRGLKALVVVTPATGVTSDALQADVAHALGQYATPYELALREPATADIGL